MIRKDSRNIILSVLGVLILIISVIGISYAIFMFSSLGKEENIINTGTISMEYDESEDKIIKIEGATPISDSVGMAQNEYFDFSINATIGGQATISYEIRAKKLPVDGLELSDSDVKLYLEKEANNQYLEVMSPRHFELMSDTVVNNGDLDKDTMLLYRGSFINNNSTTKSFKEKYRLRMWLGDQTVIDNISRMYKIKVDVYASVNNN